MPLNLDGPLTQELLIRQAQEPTVSPEQQNDLSPTLLALLGAAADGASTYGFLKSGTGKEGNRALSGMSPLGAGIGAASSGLAGVGLAKLLGKKFPKLADALIANQGARQIGLAAENISSPGVTYKDSSDGLYNKKVGSAMTHDPLKFIK